MRNYKGYALIFVLVMVALIILSVTAVALVTFNDLSMANMASRNMKAYYIAEAGLAKRFMDLRAGDTTSSTPDTVFLFTSADSGKFSGPAPTMVAGGLFVTYRIDSTGTYKNVTRKVSLTVRQVSISRYSYLSDRETYAGNPIWFMTGDILHGPIYTNDQLHVSGTPIFDGPVSTVNPAIDYYHGGPPTDVPDFRQSLTLGAPAIQMPTSVDMLTGPSGIQNAAQNGGLNLSGDTTIAFLFNGTVNVTNASINKGKTKNMSLPANGVIYVNNGYKDNHGNFVNTGTVNISGRLKGDITIGAAGDIYITNNLTYNTDPRTNPNSADMLGIVAGNNVYVDQNAPNNMEIDGYVVALNTSFAVENYQNGLKGTLTLYGGITQENRGAIGTFNSHTNTRISGYAKNYNYDTRLMTSAPVCFPPAKDTNGRTLYTKVLWSES